MGEGGTVVKKSARVWHRRGRGGKKAQMEWWQNGESLLRWGGKEGTSSRDIDLHEKHSLLFLKKTFNKSIKRKVRIAVPTHYKPSLHCSISTYTSSGSNDTHKLLFVYIPREGGRGDPWGTTGALPNAIHVLGGACGAWVGGKRDASRTMSRGGGDPKSMCSPPAQKPCTMGLGFARVHGGGGGGRLLPPPPLPSFLGCGKKREGGAKKNHSPRESPRERSSGFFLKLFGNFGHVPKKASFIE